MSLLLSLSLSLSLSPSDNCKKCALVFDDVISSCEIINCQSTQVQVRYNRVEPPKQDPLNKEHLSYIGQLALHIIMPIHYYTTSE